MNQLRTARPAVVVGGAVLALCAAYLGIHLYAEFFRPDPFPFGDFFVLWSYARVAITQGAVPLYDMGHLHAAQVAMGMAPSAQNPFPYPPTFLLMIWPLGWMPFGAALAIWIGATFTFYLLATLWGLQRNAILVLTMLLAPTTAITIVSGQTGFLAAGLLLTGLRCAEKRPVLAGVLFGLLSYKPQLGLMVPVALIAVGQWRCLVVAVAATFALMGLSSWAFGWSIWHVWIEALPEYARWFDARTDSPRFIPTVLMNLQSIGAPALIARLAQAVAACLAAVTVWVCVRRGPRGLALVTVLIATCLATPHAFVYDLPMLTSAIVWFAAYRLQKGTLLSPVEVVVLVMVLLFPAVMTISDAPLPVSTICLGLFLVVILWHRRHALSGVFASSVTPA